MQHSISSGQTESVRCLPADVTRSSVTPGLEAGLSVLLDLGVYVFLYYLALQSAALTTGHKASVQFTGTKTIFAANLRWVTAATTASDDVPDQDHVAAPGGVVSSFTARTPGNAGWGATTDVDAINVDVLYIIEGIIGVSVAGSLDLYWAPEAAANATLKKGSSLILWKTG